MDGLGVIFAVLFSLLYPLVASTLVWRWKLSGEPFKPVLVAFLAAAVMFYIAYLRKVYVFFLSGIPLYTVDLIATGFVEEAAKLLVLLTPAVKGRLTPSNGAFYGLVAGFGFGAGEALLVLANSALAIPSLMVYTIPLYFVKIILPEIVVTWFFDFVILYYFLLPLLAIISSGPLVFSIPLLGIYERAVVVILHGTLTGIVGWGLAKGETLKFYLAAVGLHILIDFFAVLYALELVGVLTVEVIITAITVTSFLYVVMKGGQQA
ncbi:MAG: hypothetical protein QXN15_06445 [Candidatus Jordarchaeales archaeon]|nr:hypothetical protein [Candidatus Jordarchaeia archaeon]